MENETIIQGLKPYLIGEKIRALRLKKSLGLVELGKHSGLSAALLSKIERGKLIPTLPTLLRIAMVFSVGLEYFFDHNRSRNLVEVVRRDERQRFPERPGAEDIAYWFESLDFKTSERKLNSFYAEFVLIAVEKLRPHQHAGVEMLYMIEGALCLKIGGEDFELTAGDAVYFAGSTPHYYHRTNAGGNCRALVVTAN
ncbi:MAG: XRE family transcriptional regulator [Acidobacteriota bacterium]|nr:XRE family transcriptional regulator [Acidobacteriota bacterium]